ncbi:MAG: sugar phosphate nucleotidyltransferase [Thermoanaerobaculia bacterium]
MRAMILAAGYGTRFRPVTHQYPKPMLPLCLRPLISWAIEPLLAAGVKEIAVNLHHLPDFIERYLRGRYASCCELYFSREEEILGTGGGIRRARPFLDRGDSFFVVNGDTIQFPPWNELEASRRRQDAISALCLRHPPEDDRFTPVWFDGEEVTGFGEGRGRALMFSGSHALSTRVFDLLPDRDFSGITEHVYAPVTRNGSERLAGVVDDGLWFDIGTPRRYLEASDRIRALTVSGSLALPPAARVDHETESVVADNAVLSRQSRRVTAGVGARVEEGAELTGSVIWRGVSIGRGARVHGCIITDDVVIPPGRRMENALVCCTDGLDDLPPEATLCDELVVQPIDPACPMICD